MPNGIVVNYLAMTENYISCGYYLPHTPGSNLTSSLQHGNVQGEIHGSPIAPVHITYVNILRTLGGVGVTISWMAEC
jgi:hypothetical protein